MLFWGVFWLVIYVMIYWLDIYFEYIQVAYAAGFGVGGISSACVERDS